MKGKGKMADTKALTKLVIFTSKLGNGIGKSLEDGKITFSDVMNFIDPLIALPAAFNDIEKIPEEFRDLDEAERQQLVEDVKSELDLADDKAEEFVEDTFNLGTQFGAYINKHFL